MFSNIKIIFITICCIYSCNQITTAKIISPEGRLGIDDIEGWKLDSSEFEKGLKIAEMFDEIGGKLHDQRPNSIESDYAKLWENRNDGDKLPQTMDKEYNHIHIEEDLPDYEPSNNLQILGPKMIKDKVKPSESRKRLKKLLASSLENDNYPSVQMIQILKENPIDIPQSDWKINPSIAKSIGFASFTPIASNSNSKQTPQAKVDPVIEVEHHSFKKPLRKDNYIRVYDRYTGQFHYLKVTQKENKPSYWSIYDMEDQHYYPKKSVYFPMKYYKSEDLFEK